MKQTLLAKLGGAILTNYQTGPWSTLAEHKTIGNKASLMGDGKRLFTFINTTRVEVGHLTTLNGNIPM